MFVTNLSVYNTSQIFSHYTTNPKKVDVTVKLITAVFCKMLDQQQLISGIGILLAFFVGYRHGVKTSKKGEFKILYE